MFKKVERMQPQREIPQTEDEVWEAGGEIGCTEDEIIQTEDETVETMDVVTETERKKHNRENGHPRQQKTREKQFKERADGKEKDETQGADKRSIAWMLQEAGPYLAALLVVCMVAFGILAIVRRSVDVYGENVLQKNEEYLLYESSE